MIDLSPFPPEYLLQDDGCSRKKQPHHTCRTGLNSGQVTLSNTLFCRRRHFYNQTTLCCISCRIFLSRPRSPAHSNFNFRMQMKPLHQTPGNLAEVTLYPEQTEVTPRGSCGDNFMNTSVIVPVCSNRSLTPRHLLPSAFPHGNTFRFIQH